MPRGSSNKRERQYEHIKESAGKRGASEGRAKEIAGRTVNKQRAQAGETKGSSSRTTSRSTSSTRSRGGEPTKEQLYNEAKKRNIQGRSDMSKDELKKALGRR
ncbi:hypothetical protein GCM10010218_53520 [Streptomyces mashuensis]|uniref:Plasmid stabilization protein n=1 Tax=Streptomyces mashuensis TaxID=33904 RepID=A0A919B7E4_9ACTN|nr:plasmid stabilization protein [Streptomyces mashuensis]GHF65342.1 hypothetical protein GCM10010218_53520 [Streptomyces mashuensis]